MQVWDALGSEFKGQQCVKLMHAIVKLIYTTDHVVTARDVLKLKTKDWNAKALEAEMLIQQVTLMRSCCL